MRSQTVPTGRVAGRVSQIVALAAPTTPATPEALAAEVLAGSLHDYLLGSSDPVELAGRLAADLGAAGLLPPVMQPADAKLVAAVRERATGYEGIYMSQRPALRLLDLIQEAYHPSPPTP